MVDNGYWNKSIRPWRRTSEHGYESELRSSFPHALLGKINLAMNEKDIIKDSI